MEKFKFKAKNKKGEEYEGTMEAADKYELARKLRDEGSIVPGFRFLYIDLGTIQHTKQHFELNIRCLPQRKGTFTIRHIKFSSINERRSIGSTTTDTEFKERTQRLRSLGYM